MFVYNPDGFEPKRYMPSHLHPYGDCARVLVHVVETARVFNKVHDSDFVPRKAAYLRRLVHKEMYKPIRDALIGSGVLDMDDHYIVGEQSYGFRIGERFADSLFRRYKLSHRASIRRLRRVRDEQCPVLTDNTLLGLQAWLKKVDVAYEEAWSSLRGLNLPAHTPRSRHLSLAMLHDREFFFKPDCHGRVHTNLTNLWGGFRQFLSFQGERLVNIDIGNSQPLFFGIAVMSWLQREMTEQDCTRYDLLSPSSFPFHYDAESIMACSSVVKRGELPEDLRRYVQITEEARFYEHMMTALGKPVTCDSRDAFKKEFFAKVFYCKPNYFTRERKAFAKEFPTVLDHITRLKQADPRNAPLALQRAESDFVIRTVCKRILEESPSTPLWTIHDSILTTASQGSYVRLVMEEEFAKLGVHPRLRIEGCGSERSSSPCSPHFRTEVLVSDAGSALLDGNPPTTPLTPQDRPGATCPPCAEAS